MWISIAISGYALLAVEAVISKYILAARMKSWQLYAFYIGLFSAFGFVFAPFGLKWYGVYPFAISVLSGIIFYISLLFLYRSLLFSSASRVYVLYGAAATISTTILAKTFLGEIFTAREIFGILFLLLGGTFISYKFYEWRFFSNYHRTIASGFLVALSLILLKYGYNEQKFVTGYVLSRFGLLTGALFSLAVPSFRKAIRNNLKKRGRVENAKNFAGTLGAKAIAGAGTLLINIGIAAGSVAIVSAFVSVQYLLTFLFALILSFYLKKIYVERFSWLNFFTKMAGIVLVALGTVLVIFK